MSPLALPETGRRRVVTEGVRPAVDGGRFAIRRTPGGVVVVGPGAFADGHDRLVGRVRCRRVRTGRDVGCYT